VPGLGPELAVEVAPQPALEAVGGQVAVPRRAEVPETERWAAGRPRVRVLETRELAEKESLAAEEERAAPRSDSRHRLLHLK
jgi:hypothetical protein